MKKAREADNPTRTTLLIVDEAVETGALVGVEVVTLLVVLFIPART